MYSGSRAKNDPLLLPQLKQFPVFQIRSIRNVSNCRFFFTERIEDFYGFELRKVFFHLMIFNMFRNRACANESAEFFHGSEYFWGYERESPGIVRTGLPSSIVIQKVDSMTPGRLNPRVSMNPAPLPIR
jgi:hypothetical protein